MITESCLPLFAIVAPHRSLCLHIRRKMPSYLHQ